MHILRQTLAGKTINRMLMNRELRNISISGRVLDLGAGTIRSSYFDFLRAKEPIRVTSIDIMPDRKPDIMADLEQPLPVSDGEYDTILCFNLLEHLYHKKGLLLESYRILKARGQFIGYVPFLVKFHPDPHDYFRYTEQALRRLLEESAFSDVTVVFIGRGALTAAWSQMEYMLPRFCRWVVTYAVFGLDAFILKWKPVFKNKYALGYVFIAHK